MLKAVLAASDVQECSNIKKAILSFNLNIRIVACYISGLPALDFLKNNHADIFITDVHLPKIDGIDILKELKENDINIKAVLISDSADFGYTKSAINLNAVGYVLKPIEHEELKTAITAAVSLCEKENAEKKVHEELIKRMQDSMPMLKEQFMRNLLYRSDVDIEYIKKNCDLLGFDLISNDKKVITAKITGIADSEITYSTICAISDYIQDFSDESCRFFTFVVMENELVIVLKSTCSQKEIYEKISMINNSVCNRYDIDLLMGVSETAKDITRLHMLYEQSRLALEHAMLSYKNVVVLYEDIREKNEKGLFSIKRLQEDIRNIINSNRIEEIDDFLSEYFENVRQGGRVYLKIFSYSLVNLTELILSEHGSSFDEVVGSKVIWEKLENFDTIVNLKQWLKNIIKCVIEIIHKDDMENNIIARKIKDIIEERYSDRLTIEEIATEISYSKKHTQRIFLKETGKTIFEYLTVFRMEKAKELLIQKDSKIYAVAEHVGYKNTAHFTELFKEYTGVTPANFKKQLQVD